jgi:putative restriction endonuclease
MPQTAAYNHAGFPRQLGLLPPRKSGEDVASMIASGIQPYAKYGPHDVRNGVLLRADLHRLFDQGYVTITPEYRLEVNPRLKEDYRNGRSYYPLHGSSVSIPTAAAAAPSVDFLRWHNERVYRAT